MKMKNKKTSVEQRFFYFEAVRTGLEPATSCVTGRHSNQLNYRTINPPSGSSFKGVQR